jgi:xylose isomerase
MRTYGAGLWLFGQFVDRYATDAYGPPISTIGAIERAGRVEGLSCLDVNFPFSDTSVTVGDVKDALEQAGLRAHAITPHLYTRRFQAGSFTNPDGGIRADAASLCKRGVDVARELGASYLKFWPGQDGHDYPLQANYTRLWDLQLSGVREVVESAPDVQFAIEYKLKEPRNHMTFSTVARTLLGIEEIGAPNLGIVLDFGHSLFAKETPADALELAHRYGRLISVELNDNLLEWDDDMAVGSVHALHTIEFLISLRRIGWDRPILLDQFPFREDPVRAAHESIRTIEAFEKVIDSLDIAALNDAQEHQDALTAQALVLDALLPGRSGSR